MIKDKIALKLSNLDFSLFYRQFDLNKYVDELHVLDTDDISEFIDICQSDIELSFSQPFDDLSRYRLLSRKDKAQMAIQLLELKKPVLRQPQFHRFSLTIALNQPSLF